MAKKIEEVAFPTKYSKSVSEGSFEVFNKPSMTEPDNAMSIPEIIARFTRGYGIPVQQHEWISGSASEEGEQFNDNEAFFEDFIQKQSVKQESAPSQMELEDSEKPSEGEDPRA